MPIDPSQFQGIGSIKNQLQAIKSALPPAQVGNTTAADQTDLETAYTAMTAIETRWFAQP